LSDLIPERVRPKIATVLRYFLVDLFEIPFIVRYRSDYLRPDLGVNELWEIFDWDEKWFHLRRRKEQLKLLIDQIEDEQEKISYLGAIDTAQSERDLDDLVDHVVLYNEAVLGQKMSNQNHKSVKAKRSFKAANKIERFPEFLKVNFFFLFYEKKTSKQNEQDNNIK
jgi:transcriptional accessory protein Tex/SPT6